MEQRISIERMEQAIRDIALNHDGQTIAIFSHGTAIRQFTANARKMSPEEWKTLGHSDNTAVTKLSFHEGEFSIEYEGDASHLDESISTLARQSWWRKDGKQAPDINLWYRPIDWDTEKHLYLEARRDAWTTTHKDKGFVSSPAMEFSLQGILKQSCSSCATCATWSCVIKVYSIISPHTNFYRFSLLPAAVPPAALPAAFRR